MNTKGTLSAGRPSARTNKATTLASLTDKKNKRVNFDLTPDLHLKLKVYAAKQNKTITDILTEFVEQLAD